MAVRASAAQRTLIVPEVTPGTAVTSNLKELQLLSYTVAPHTEGREPVVGLGRKFAADVTSGREWSTFNLSDSPLTYNEVVYPLSGVFGASNPAPTQIGTTGGYTWKWTPGNTLWTPKSYTLEQGDNAVAAHNHRVTNLIHTALGFEFTPTSATVSGEGIANALEVSLATLHLTGLTTLDPVLVQPTEVNIYLDTTSGGLGTTKLTTINRTAWRITDVYTAKLAINSAVTGWAALVDGVPGFAVELEPDADTEAMSLLGNMRAGDKLFLRIVAQRAANDIGTAATHTFQIDTCVKVQDVGDFDETDGVWTLPFTLAPVYDVTWGKAFEFTAVNKLSAL